MATSVPDPVEDPTGYRRALLSYLGGDDPAVAQAQASVVVRTVISQAGERVRTKPGPGEWSVLEVGGHLLDTEIVVAGRYRWILAHDEPLLAGYDQELWVERLGHNEDAPGELLAAFEGLRRANLALWRRTSEEERARVGIHEERGPESFDLLFRLIAGHDRLHLEQARRALERLS